MTVAYSDEKLLTFAQADLVKIFVNAQRHAADPTSNFHADGMATLKQFETLGINVRGGSFLLDSPAGKTMQHVIFANKEAAFAAARQGLAPMEVIDPLLHETLGEAYRGDNGATVQAGYVVANLMRQHMWEVKPNARANLPDTCVAKTAALYTYIPSKRT